MNLYYCLIIYLILVNYNKLQDTIFTMLKSLKLSSYLVTTTGRCCFLFSMEIRFQYLFCYTVN